MQRKVEDWKKADISKWLALLQLTQYEDSFKSMSGKVRKAEVSEWFMLHKHV